MCLCVYACACIYVHVFGYVMSLKQEKLLLLSPCEMCNLLMIGELMKAINTLNKLISHIF